ncbi:hypothetical protein SUGI_0412240 [Cryptomeria japonica]|nr:hypothetical protein SUGI_0412240 [Cryptomeria japonica]
MATHLAIVVTVTLVFILLADCRLLDSNSIDAGMMRLSEKQNKLQVGEEEEGPLLRRELKSPPEGKPHGTQSGTGGDTTGQAGNTVFKRSVGSVTAVIGAPKAG